MTISLPACEPSRKAQKCAGALVSASVRFKRLLDRRWLLLEVEEANKVGDAIKMVFLGKE